MDKDILWFAENMCGLNLTEDHKEILLAFQEARDRGQKIFINYGRIQGKGLLREIFYSFENWLRDQKIADLEAKLAGLQQENKKVKECFDKASENCTFDELREIILTGEENSNERVIKMLNEQVEALEAELVLARNTSINTNKMQIIHLQAENIELEQQIADMKANQEKEINRICKTHIEANVKLKQQLAEKDNSIGMLNQHLTDKAIEIECLGEELADNEKYIKMLEKDRRVLNNIVEKYADKCKKYKQDKIELLEKIVNYLEDIQAPLIVVEYIDNQIKQLKEGK